jgi:hypothetical protein
MAILCKKLLLLIPVKSAAFANKICCPKNNEVAAQMNEICCPDLRQP